MSPLTCKDCGSVLIKDSFERGYQTWKCSNVFCSSHKNKTPQAVRKIPNWLILIIGVFILGGLAFATTTYISDNRADVAGNTRINDSGMYYNDGSTYRGVSSGTADVVVCRGNSIADDIYKSIKWVSGCDVVCKSTDSSCTTMIQLALDIVKPKTGLVYLSSGVYPINVSSLIYHNVYGNGDYALQVWGGTNLIGSGISSTKLKFFGLVPSAGGGMIVMRALGVNYSQVSDFTIDLNADNLDYGSYTGNNFLLGIVGSLDNWIGGNIVEHLRIINGNIQQNSGTANLQGIGINTFICPQCTYKDIYINNVDNGFWVTRAFDNTITQYNVDNLYIDGSKRFGVYFEASDGDTFSNVQIINSNWSIRFAGGTSSNIIMDNVHIYNNSGRAFSISGGSTTANNLLFSDFTIKDVIADGVYNEGMYISSTIQNSTFLNFIIENTAGNSVVSDGININLDKFKIKYSLSAGLVISDVSKHNIITNSEVAYSSNMGIQMKGGKCIDCIVHDNSINSYSDNFYIQSGSSDGRIDIINPICYGSAKNCVGIYSFMNVSIINPITTISQPININNYNNTFVDTFVYPAGLSQYYCTTSSTFNDKTIHNSTTSCTCTGGAWKCWGMS